jgi:transcriptional regulator of acetoin/glycerol metabolism
MESLSDGVVLFDAYGRLVYANESARRLADIEPDAAPDRADALRPRLLALGGRVAALRSGGTSLGEVVFLPHVEQARTLAERERQAIVDTLQRTSGRLAEAARRLGISRTTLWRRLKAYGLRPGNGRVGSGSRV